MQIILRYLFSIMLPFFLVACAPPGRHDAGNLYMSICYIPISSGTFVPMTRKNFEKQCAKLERLSRTDIRYEKISVVLNDRSRNGIFDEHAIRVMIAFSNGTMLLIDQEGVVESAGEQKHMSTSALVEVERILDEMEEEIAPRSIDPSGKARKR